MLAEKTFIGQRLDLEHYKGIAIEDHEFEILDQDGDAVDLSVYSRITYTLFAKPHGKELQEVDQDVPADNILLLNVPASVFDIRSTLYYYEVAGYPDASPSTDKVILFYGIKDLI